MGSKIAKKVSKQVEKAKKIDVTEKAKKAVAKPSAEAPTKKKTRELDVVVIDQNHPEFGGMVSDDSSFEARAFYVNLKTSVGAAAGEQSKIGVFVGDGQEIGMSANSVSILTPKEARNLAEVLLAASFSAQHEKRRQKKHRDSLPKKSKSTLVKSSALVELPQVELPTKKSKKKNKSETSKVWFDNKKKAEEAKKADKKKNKK